MHNRIIGNPTTTPIAIDNKVDKVDGKGLSTNDFTDGDKKLLNNLPIKDLGVFDANLNNGDMGFDEDVYQSYIDTIDNLDSGIYTLKYMEAGFNRTEFYFVTKGNSLHGDYSSQIRFIDNSVFRTNAEHMEIERREYSDNRWTEWSSFDQRINELNNRVGNLDNLNTVVTDNLVDAINEICRDMVYSAQIVYSVEEIQDEYIEIPTVETTMELINPTPVTDTQIGLYCNMQFNFGEVETLSLVFPTWASDGDVIYLTFKSGATPTTLTIDITNTSDIEVIPEANTGYEIFGKYNGEIWIVNYSEYTVSEV